MKLAILMLFLLSCEKSLPPQIPQDIRLSDKVLDTGVEPHAWWFGYDLEYARDVYKNPYLQFHNLDPSQAKSEEYLAALSLFLTRITYEQSHPIWVRKLSYPESPLDLLVKYGMLPSPYKHQLQAAPVNAAPLNLSLGETHYVKNERSYTSINCFICHAGIYGNHVVAGAPNKNVDLIALNLQAGRYLELSNEVRDLFGDTAHSVLAGAFMYLLTGEWPIIRAEEQQTLKAAEETQKFIYRAFNPFYLTPRGGNTGPFFTIISWLTLRPNGVTLLDTDPSVLQGLYSPAIERVLKLRDELLQGVIPFAAPRPWWVARYSGFHFWIGLSPEGSPQSDEELALFLQGINIKDPHVTSFKSRVHISHQIQTYITQISSPPFPGVVDKKLAARGQELYGTHCAKCHGKLVPHEGKLRLDYKHSDAKKRIATLGVDQAYYDMFASFTDTIYSIINSNKELKQFDISVRLPKPGESPFIYAPPLIGLWASAPYLHNQSVPTLYDVLNPATRPTIWRVDKNPYAYDYDKIGVAYVTVADYEDVNDYDTRRFGQSAGGHLIGKQLTDPDRWALIEFLKTLTTESVLPNPIPH